MALPKPPPNIRNQPISKWTLLWRNYGVFIGFVGATCLFMIPVYVYPKLHASEYRKIAEINRKGINQEDIQPGGMKVWSDPFGRK